MSGHSHWAGIKHKKELADSKRGKIFSKLTKDIMLAVRDAGADPDSNLRLRYAIDKAKEANMPKNSIERAIQKVSGAGDANALAELTYEGYGPGGTAVLAEVITDNRNRTASELRKIFDTSGGKMGESGCVSFLFDKKGIITISVSSTTEEKLMEVILEAGAENMAQEGDMFTVTTAPTEMHAVRTEIEKAGIKIDSSELAQIPQNTIELDEEKGRKALNLISRLEDHDDVQNVYTNFMPSQAMVDAFESEQK